MGCFIIQPLYIHCGIIFQRERASGPQRARYALHRWEWIQSLALLSSLFLRSDDIAIARIDRMKVTIVVYWDWRARHQAQNVDRVLALDGLKPRSEKKKNWLCIWVLGRSYRKAEQVVSLRAWCILCVRVWYLGYVLNGLSFLILIDCGFCVAWWCSCLILYSKDALVSVIIINKIITNR